MSKLVYKPIEPLSKLEIQEQLEKGKEDELILLPLSVGEYGESWKEERAYLNRTIHRMKKVWSEIKKLCPNCRWILCYRE